MSIFELIAIVLTAAALLGYVNHRFVGLPDTVGITFMGLLATLVLTIVGRVVPGAVGWAASFADRLDFQEIVFHGVLAFLLFAGSLHIDLGLLSRQRVAVLALATVGVLLSTLIVGYGTHVVLGLVGVSVALPYCFLFGALISPTDPIAVLGVLKTAGAPDALETAIAGESLFNDGTGVVVYLVLLGLVTGQTTPAASDVAVLLAQQVGGAVLVGLAIGYGGYFLLRGIESYPVEILITIALAVGGYALAERLHASAPIAVVVIGLVIGTDGVRLAMSPKTRQHLFSFWDLLDQLLNLTLFGLIGVRLLSLDADRVSWFAAALVLPLVLAARLVSVAIPVWSMRRWRARTPHAVAILTWGGLRGAISIALALSMPAFMNRDVLVAATYAVVLFSLLVQAPTLGPLLRVLGVGTRGSRARREDA